MKNKYSKVFDNKYELSRILYWLKTNTVEKHNNCAVNDKSFIQWLIQHYPSDAKIIEEVKREEIRQNALLFEEE